MAVQTQIQTRRGAAATWTSTNPTLAAGEIGFESDTNKFKIGTGSTAWASLPYAASISPLTTKGDLYTYSTADARLAVGANGETLVADSSATTGLRYTAGTVQANPVINSAMQNWQRGTSVSLAASTPGYTADRWYVVNGANQATTVSRQATGDTTNLPFIQYCARVQRNSGQTGIGTMSISQPFESINSVPFAGKTVTFSYYARKGADFSPTSSVITNYLASGTGTDQNQQGAGYTGQALPINGNQTLTTTWQRFTQSATIAATATEIQPIITFTPTGTAGAADYFEVTGFQIDIGSVALPFRTYAATIQGELAACQRYYEKSYAQGTAPGTANTWGNASISGLSSLAASTAGNVYGGNTLQFKVTKRTTPTMVLYDYGGTANAVRIYPSDTIRGGVTATPGVTDTGGGYISVDNSSANAITTNYSVNFSWTASAEL
jgi:hypothetical protein